MTAQNAFARVATKTQPEGGRSESPSACLRGEKSQGAGRPPAGSLTTPADHFHAAREALAASPLQRKLATTSAAVKALTSQVLAVDPTQVALSGSSEDARILRQSIYAIMAAATRAMEARSLTECNDVAAALDGLAETFRSIGCTAKGV